MSGTATALAGAGDPAALAALFDACPTGVLVVELDGRLLSANPAACELLGLDANRLLVAYTTDYLLLAGRLRQLHDAGEDGIQLVQRVVRPDGQPRWVEFRLRQLPAGTHERPTAAVFLTDRTRLQLQERTIRAQVAGLDLALSQANLAVVVTDGASRVVRWSPGAEQLFGSSAQGAERSPLAQLLAVPQTEIDPLLTRAAAGEVIRGATLNRRVGGEDQQFSTSVALAATDEFGGEGRRGIDSARFAWVLLPSEPSGSGATLRASERRLRKILQNINDTVTIIDEEGRTIASSGHFSAQPILGYAQEAWEGGMNVFDLVHPDDQPWVGQQLVHILEHPGDRAGGLIRMRAADGSYIDAEGWAINLLDDPDVAGILVTTRNVSDRIRNESFVTGQAEVLRQVASSAPLESTMRRLTDLVATQVDGAATTLLQARPDGPPRAFGSLAVPTALAESLLRLAPSHGGGPLTVDEAMLADRPELLDTLHRSGRRVAVVVPVLAAGATSTAGHPTQLGSLICLLDADRTPTQRELEVLGSAADLAAIAIEREQSERDLAHQALHDELTGLANRNLLLDRLEQAHSRARRRGRNLALLFLDLDRFKTVNDALGHDVGDELLRQFADRLRLLVRPEDTVARFGGDEFVVLVEHVADDHDIAQLADRLEHAMSAPFELGGQQLAVTVSVGIVVGDGEDDPAGLLRNADTAMYRAKELGRNRTEIYDRDLEAHLADRTQLSAELRTALAEGHLQLAYLPVVDLETGGVAMVEAQLRWDHPLHGRLMPIDFVAVAEESGLSLELGAWMIERGLSDLAALGREVGWSLETAAGATRSRDACSPPRLSIKLSSRQLAHPEMVARLRQALSRHRFLADHLSIDVPERILASAGELLLRNLEELRALGVSIGIDEVGGTHSSALLSVLSRVQVDLLKIDPSLVTTLLGPRHDGEGGEPRQSLVGGLIGLAHGLGLAVAAQGVDSALWRQQLQRLGCDLAQGSVVGTPVDASRLVKLLDASH